MALINTYGIWNNKGGVGKSTITFHLATRYAENNPNKIVLVIDLCPQSNSSMMLLGGGEDGKGEKNAVELCTLPTPKTVVGYLSSVISRGPGAALPNPEDFVTQVSTLNSKLPSNLYLLCGDGNLEPISPAITNAANAPALTSSVQPWAWIHNIFRDFIAAFTRAKANQDVIVFIDTNPAFGVYTELAITACDRLICPVNADDSSRTAANAMTMLLHGTNPPHPIYGSWTFAASAKKHNTNIPRIHLIVGNRLTQYAGTATAFQALSDATSKALYEIYTANPDYFTNGRPVCANIEEFKQHYSISLRDFNTAGVATTHLGNLLSSMKESSYLVHGQQVTLDKKRIGHCLDAVDAIIAKL